MTWRVAGAARATIGKRANQEDSFEIWPPEAQTITQGGEGLLAVVADGMGGHAGGEVAGELASRTFTSHFLQSEAALGRRLEASLQAANSEIAARVSREPKLKGMGCTLVGVWIGRNGLSWVSVGDSLLLLFRAPQVHRLNADHSLGAFLDEQARRKKISAEEAEKNRYRNALRSAVNGKAIELIDLEEGPYPLADGDWLILASDGMTTLSGDEIGDIIYTHRDSSPDDVAEALIAAVAAKDEPDQDNTTVLALKVIASDAKSCAADEAPTRIVRPEPVTLLSDAGQTTKRILQSPPDTKPIRNHPGIMVAAAAACMFLAGWLIRAWLD